MSLNEQSFARLELTLPWEDRDDYHPKIGDFKMFLIVPLTLFSCFPFISPPSETLLKHSYEYICKCLVQEVSLDFMSKNTFTRREALVYQRERLEYKTRQEDTLEGSWLSREVEEYE